MPDPELLVVDARPSKPSYASGEAPEFTTSVRTQTGTPVEADIQWGLRVLPDGEWIDYAREFPVQTSADTGNAAWVWPVEYIGPPDPGEYEMAIDARAYDAGHMTGEGSAGLTFRVEA